MAVTPPATAPTDPLNYKMDTGDFGTSNSFTAVPFGAHTFVLRIGGSDQASCYYAKTNIAADFNNCSALPCDNIYLLAKDQTGTETTIIPRQAGTNALKNLTLSAATFDDSPLLGVTYSWTGPNNFTATTASIQAGMIGTYKLTLTRGTSTCSQEIALSAMPCAALPATGVNCSNEHLTGIADDPTNRLTALNPGDVVQAGDFEVTIIEATGNKDGWRGKGYVKVPYLQAQVSIVLTNAVFNSCYQLTNANATADNATVVTAYDPNWGNVVSVDEIIDNFKNLISDFNDFLKTYKGTPEDKVKMEDFLSKMRENTNNPNLIPEVKTELETKINLISSTWNEVKSCPASGSNLRISAENTVQTICKIKELQDQGEDLSRTPLKPTNTSFPELNIPSRCNTNIPNYWRNVLQLKTTVPQQYPDATGFNWNVTAYTLYDANWKTNNKWWWIKEVCSPDNCTNTQMFVFSPKHDDYILMYDKNADCEGNMQAMVDLADNIGNTYAFIFEIMLGGPEDLAFEYGAMTVKYVGKTLNLAQKAAKAKNISKAITLYIKESKLAKAAGKKVDDVKTWWGKLLRTKLLKLFDEVEISNIKSFIPTGAKNSVINASTVTSNAIRKIPFPSTSLATKVDNYIKATTTTIRGQIGEDIAKELVESMDDFAIKASKLTSDNGMDIVAIKGTGSNMVIRIIESKPINNGVIQLGETVGKGTQMSNTWLNATIQEMRNSPDLDVRATGDILLQNFARIERYVMSVDKSTKEIILLKLNPF